MAAPVSMGRRNRNKHMNVPLATLLVGLIIAVVSMFLRHRKEQLLHTERRNRDAGRPLEQAQQLVEKDAAGRREIPAGVAALGIIPLAVGLAYLVFYRSEKSRLTSAPESRSSPHQ
jgi:hypothetical protein